jgi:hypothetical protein
MFTNSINEDSPHLSRPFIARSFLRFVLIIAREIFQQIANRGHAKPVKLLRAGGINGEV